MIMSETLFSGMFGWVKGSGFLSKVVEKTKTVTENVITTLDPQMKDFIHSGGDIEVRRFDSQLDRSFLDYSNANIAEPAGSRPQCFLGCCG